MFKKLKKLEKWEPPSDWLIIKTLDTHTGGEPLRIIIGGFPEIPGDTILEKRRYLMENLDYLRKALIWEPRGHADMYGAIITEPVSKDADFGVIFLHNEGYSTMCGHATIALGKVAVECGLVEAREPITEIKMDSPAGLIKIYVQVKDGKAKKVYFHNVPSFVLYRDEEIDVPELGRITYDLAYGGAFYAFINAEDFGLKCTPEYYRELIDIGMKIKRAIMAEKEIEHPFEKDLGFLYGTIFVGSPYEKDSHSRHVCIFAEGEVDRSPTGTGVSARLAILYEKGEIDIGEEIIIESIIGSKFTGKIVEETQYGPYKAIIPEVGGTAHIIAKNTFMIDPEDPLKYGFFLR
ncbi:MAG: proline racemase family protein [Thermococcus sp.]|nr:proline racemase family protein [Thermococcus sp.]